MLAKLPVNAGSKPWRALEYNAKYEIVENEPIVIGIVPTNGGSILLENFNTNNKHLLFQERPD